MAENLRFDNRTKSLSIISIIIISSILLLFNWTSPVSESLNVHGQPAETTSLQDNIGDLESNAQDVAKKFRDTKGEKIPNQYIVVLKDDFLASTKSSVDKAKAQGAELKHIYSHALHGFAVKVPNEQALVAIMKNPEVDYVQPDVEMEAFAQTLPTGVNRVDGDLSSARSGNGAGSVNVDIAILDTGIQLSHPDLNVFKHVTFVSGTSTGNDDNGHGTSVAGIAAAKDNSAGVVGIAPGARLWAIKVLANNGVGMSSDIIKGIDYVTEHANEIEVVNLSFGGEGTNDALRTAISGSVGAGVTYVAAAGNQGRDASSFVPASFPEVITVSAIADYDGKCGGLSTISTSSGKDDAFASFSNHGSVIDMAAPGVQIRTTARGSSYTSSFTGTSASTPHVTGAAALYNVENPSASPSEIKNALADLGSLPSTICDGNGHGYFTGDKDSTAEPLLYLASDTVLPEPDCTGNLPISSAVASASESTNPPSNAIDNNFGTRWANPALGSWIRVDLGSTQSICSVDIAWYRGNERQYHFVIATSTTGVGFSNVFSGDSSGTTSSPEKYVFPAVDARYVKVTINGNTQNNAASIYELDVFGSSLLTELPPVANSQAVTTNKNTAKAITLSASDPNNDPLTYSLLTQPTHGTITGVAPNLMYNPTTGYVGPDSFTFKANDGIADSNIATVSITVRDPGTCTTNLPISSATASASESTHPPTHAIDNNFGTRWANPALGSWIRVDLGSTKNICSVDIAWYNGMARQYHFVIATSTTGVGFSNVFSGDSSGTKVSPEKYSFPSTGARYVKVTINGNTQNNAASIYELDVFGSLTSSALTAYHYGPSLTLSGP